MCKNTRATKQIDARAFHLRLLRYMPEGCRVLPALKITDQFGSRQVDAKLSGGLQEKALPPRRNEAVFPPTADRGLCNPGCLGHGLLGTEPLDEEVNDVLLHFAHRTIGCSDDNRNILLDCQALSVLGFPMEIGDRIREAREAKHLTQQQLADMLDVAQPTVNDWENGKHKPGRSRIPELSRRLGRSREWLEFGADPEEGRVLTPANDAANEMALFEELDVRAEGGAGAIHDVTTPEQAKHRWAVPRDFVAGQTTADPTSIKIITVYGNSMTPDFNPGERIMVDISDRVPSPPGAFVIFDGVGIVIKYLQVIPNSDPIRVRLISRNEAYTEDERTLDEIAVNGRVIGKWLWT